MRVKILGRRETPITSKVCLMCVCVFLVTETLNRGVKLSKEDLQVTTDLWENTINPACIEFERQMGKPAEAMRKALAGIIAQCVNQPSSWNTWQKVWWNRFPKVHDKGLRSKSVTSYDCPVD
jgi:hypothetical protein